MGIAGCTRGEDGSWNEGSDDWYPKKPLRPRNGFVLCSDPRTEERTVNGVVRPFTQKLDDVWATAFRVEFSTVDDLPQGSNAFALWRARSAVVKHDGRELLVFHESSVLATGHADIWPRHRMVLTERDDAAMKAFLGSNRIVAPDSTMLSGPRQDYKTGADIAQDELQKMFERVTGECIKPSAPTAVDPIFVLHERVVHVGPEEHYSEAGEVVCFSPSHSACRVRHNGKMYHLTDGDQIMYAVDG
jgi:hypothetical protein